MFVQPVRFDQQPFLRKCLFCGRKDPDASFLSLPCTRTCYQSPPGVWPSYKGWFFCNGHAQCREQADLQIIRWTTPHPVLSRIGDEAPVKVRRSSGVVEDDWRIVHTHLHEPGDYVSVMVKRPRGFIFKEVPLSEFVLLNK